MSILSESVSGYLENASWIRRMFELGSQLKAEHDVEKVYDFSLGNPDLPAPKAVIDGLKDISEHSSEPFAFGYMPNGGFPWLRDKLAQHLSQEQNVHLEGEDVILTNGAAGAINVFLRAVANPGDEIIAIAPYFVEYGFYCENHGAKLVPVRAEAKSFNPDLEAIEQAITPATKAVLINTPNNPTGAIYSTSVLKALAHLLENKSQELGHPIWLISDEPYRFLAYDGHKVPSILPLYPYSVAISSLSKNMSLPGERIGYIAISPLLREKSRLMAGLALTNRILGFVNPPVLGQQILARAMGANVDIDIYANRRKAMGEVLKDAGYEFLMPAGAFYFFPKAPGGDDVKFVNTLLEERILAVPGSGFGWPGHFRLAFCVSENIIRNAAPGFARAAATYA